MIKVALIGCGRIADLHFEAYETINGAEVAALCDSDPELLEKRSKEWKVKRLHSDYRELFEDDEIDAVEILTPHHLHEEMAIAALESGRHVALQKPMTPDLKSADRVLAAARKSNAHFRVTDNYLFYPPLVKAKEMIDKGVIGEPMNMRIRLTAGAMGGWEIPPSAWQWRLAEAREGRGIETFDHGHHMWSAARYLLGPFEKVTAMIDSHDGITDCPSVIAWKCREGIRYGSCDLSFSPDLSIPTRYYSCDEWFEVVGTRGILIVPRGSGLLFETLHPLLHFDGTRWHEYGDIPADWSEGFNGAARNFIDGIEGREPLLWSGEEAREVLAFSLALFRSSTLQRTVYLDELDSFFPGFTAWRLRRKERSSGFLAREKRGILERLGLVPDDSRYAPAAMSLTEEKIEELESVELAAGEDFQAVLEITPEGNVSGEGFLIEATGGKIRVHRGDAGAGVESRIRVPAGTWGAILSGKRRIETAYIQGKLKIEGPVDRVLRLKDILKL
jgi:predicted dehydrogenase